MVDPRYISSEKSLMSGEIGVLMEKEIRVVLRCLAKTGYRQTILLGGDMYDKKKQKKQHFVQDFNAKWGYTIKGKLSYT